MQNLRLFFAKNRGDSNASSGGDGGSSKLVSFYYCRYPLLVSSIRPAGRAVQITVFQLIINGSKFVTFNRTNRLITAVISDPLHSLPFIHLILTFRL